MTDGDQRTSHAGRGTNYSLGNPSASTIPTQGIRERGMGNSRPIPSTKYECRNRLKEEYSVIGDGKWIKRRSSMQNSNRTSDCALRANEHPNAIKFREDQYQYFHHRDARRDRDAIHPDGQQYRLNTRQMFPTTEEWHYRMKNEEYILFMQRQQLQMRKWPIQDSSIHAYCNYGSRLDKHKKVNLVEGNHPFLLKGNRSDGYVSKPSIQQPSLNTRQVSDVGHGWQYGMTDEHNLNMSRHPLSFRPWPAPHPNRNAYFAFKPRVHEYTVTHENQSRANQHQFFQHRDAGRDGNIMQHNTHHSSLNTRQILPTTDGYYGMIGEEHNLAVRKNQFKIRTRTLPVKGLERNVYFNFESGLYEYPKEQKIKSLEGHQKIYQHRDTPRSCRAITDSRIDQISNTVTNLSEKDGLEQRMRKEYKPVMVRQQSSTKYRPLKDSSGNNYSRIKLNTQGYPKLHDIKSVQGENQFFQHRNTRSDENVIQPTNSPKYNQRLNSGQILPAGDRRQHYTTSKEYASFVGGQPLRLGERNAKDLKINDESENRPRTCENSLKGQEIKALRRRIKGNKPMRCIIDRTTKSHTHVVIDEHNINKRTHVPDSKGNAEFDSKPNIFKEALDAQLMDSNDFSWSRYLLRITRVAEDYWSLLQIGLYRTDCILMLIAAIVLGTFLYFIY